jgi:hypothetical protein
VLRVRAVSTCPDAKLYLAASAVVAATMHMFGGGESSPVPTYPTVRSKYSMLTDTWTSATKPPTSGASRTLSSGPTFGSAAAVGTRIYYVGSAAGSPYGINEVYETTTDSWTSVKAAPGTAVAPGTLIAAKSNRLYAFAVKIPSINLVHMYDTTSDVWISRAPTNPYLALFGTVYHAKSPILL